MPDWNEENKYTGTIVGIDEAGRGPWAGPVVAGAVVFLNRDIDSELLLSLNDSKKLSAKKREHLYELILEESKKGNLCYGIGVSSAQEIDEINILQATFNAMRRAVEQLSVTPDVALIDGNQTPKPFSCNVKTIIKGDSISMSISAASIVAKVFRDNMMKDLAKKYPYYGFEKNAGYGTKAHIDGLKKYGVIDEHRKSYKPVAEILNNV